MKKSILKLSLITSLMLFLKSCAFAQFNPSAVGAVYPTTRTVPRADNVVLAYANGGNLTALNCIGVLDGAYSSGTTNTNDSLSYFKDYGSFMALGGVAFQFAVDSVALYKVKYYSQTVAVKNNQQTDSVYLPSTASLKSFYGNTNNPSGAGAIITIVNKTSNTIFVRGNLRTEYVDTATTCGIPQRSAKTFMFSGLAAPTSTVVANNKINSTWIVR
jgi:hypothetical protein